jgi:uncharacterized membrane protein
MCLRSARERVFQSIAFQAGGILIATPLYAAICGAGAQESTALIVAIAIFATLWSPFHNACFDLAEWRLRSRVASDRPQGLRIIHAFSHEASAMIVTVPLVMVMGGHSLAAAFALDTGLTLLYTGYAYLFHMAYDRLRPVATNKPLRTSKAVMVSETAWPA